MAATSLNVEAFLEAASSSILLDVRSPGEYNHAHIPGAQSLPLFTDEERKIIGTAYKQESRETAIKIGLDAFGPNMRRMVEATEAICRKAKTRKVQVHCWRGGMRSAAVAWLLDLYGFEVRLLEGGYKAYRNWVIAHWAMPVQFRRLAGNTGTGKTEVLQALQQAGKPVLDLEALAQHKGSAFGALPGIQQPTQEMFENLLGEQLNLLGKRFPGEQIWVEDESQRIGSINIPNAFFKRLSTMPFLYLNRSFEERLDRVVAEYSAQSTEKLVNSIIRIKKRLGPLETKTALSSLIEGDLRACFDILLKYYDKHYYPTGQADTITIDCADKDAVQIADLLKQIHP